MHQFGSGDVRYLSELYALDAPEACLLAEYPSSNSTQTRFRNRNRYIIHDPFPPPPESLLKHLGPHHLMCGWGRDLPVTSQVPPPARLLEHWERTIGSDSVPDWRPYDESGPFITLFPHESVPAAQQIVDPESNYALHSKAIIADIDRPQATVLQSVQPPCVVKLSHGYAGLGNFFIHSKEDEVAMREQLKVQWPDAKLVVNAIIEDITEDYGIQFYLHADGTLQWLGHTEQTFDDGGRWCGGVFHAETQPTLRSELADFVTATGERLHSAGYFGLVGIDVVRNREGQAFLVDVNPRLTGITPFLMLSRQFATDGFTNAIYRASCQFGGSLEHLIHAAEQHERARVVVLSAFEQSGATTCHLSVSAASLAVCQQTFADLVTG